MGQVHGAGRSVRAQRTRAELVRAAARQFDRDGFEGASLQRISGEAQTSMGALTFHFATKAGLADEVQAQARAVVQALVAAAALESEGPLDAARLMTVGLVGVLERDERVRGAARLLRERAGEGPAWVGEWRAALRAQLELAARAGQLAPRSSAAEVAVVVQCLMVGIEAAVRGRGGAARPLQSARLWELLARGIAAP